MDNGGKRYDTCERGRKRDAQSLMSQISLNFTFEGFFIDISMMEFWSILKMGYFDKFQEILEMKFLQILKNIDDRSLVT